MTFTPLENDNYDHLKKMAVADIWIDKYGDYYLILEVYKHNVRSKTKKFFIMFSGILLTNYCTDEGMDDYKAGAFIDDINPSIMKEKVA